MSATNNIPRTLATAGVTRRRKPNLRNTLPGVLMQDVFNDFFDFSSSMWGSCGIPHAIEKSTKGYPVTDIYANDDGDTVMEFALAGFKPDDINVSVKPSESCIIVQTSVDRAEDAGKENRRIARRNFSNTYVDYDKVLDLENAKVNFEDGLLVITIKKKEKYTGETLTLF